MSPKAKETTPPRTLIAYSIQPADTGTPHKFFFGPKDFDVLASIDRDLVRAIDFGWFAFIVVPLLRSLGRRFPKLRYIFADRVYRGPKLLDALADLGKWTIEIVTRHQSVGTFKPEPKRWVVERTFAWLGRNRRLAKDFEATVASAQAWIMIANVRLLSRRLARA